MTPPTVKAMTAGTTPMTMPVVTYVIVTMNRRHELARCLRSVQSQDYRDKEIIVVDNNSHDGTPELVSEEFPGIALLALDENVGVAAGRNRGVATAHGEFCIFIDDDAAFVDADATAKTVSYFQADDGLAGLAFRIRDPRTGEDDIKAIPRLNKRSLARDYDCAYFCGAGCAFRREVLTALGGFWEALFIYAEELELSYRILDQGYGLRFASGIVVDHWETPRARPSARLFHLLARNRFMIAVRHLPWRFVFSTAALWWLRMGGLALVHGEMRAFLKGLAEGFRALPVALQLRSPLQPPVIRRIAALSGRLWY